MATAALNQVIQILSRSLEASMSLEPEPLLNLSLSTLEP